MTYFDHVSKVWLVGRIARHTHDHAYLIETEAGRLVSHNRCDMHRSYLTFTPNLPEPYPKHQSIMAEKSNPGLAPVDVKPSVKQPNASCPTARCPVTRTNSQASSGPVTCSGKVVCKPNRLNF